MTTKGQSEGRSLRRRLFQACIGIAVAIGTVVGLGAARAGNIDDDDIELGNLNGSGQEKAATGREKALEHGRGKGLEKAPPMQPTTPPPPPPPLDPPPGL